MWNWLFTGPPPMCNESLFLWTLVQCSLLHGPQTVIDSGHCFDSHSGHSTTVCVIQAVLRGWARHSPLVLPIPQRVTNMKQCKLSGNRQEIGGTIQELEKLGIVHPTHSPFNSPVWPVKKPDGT